MGKKYSELAPDQRAKYSVRQNTNNAIRRGRIQKKCCQRCGAKEAEAHHKVYEQYHAILPKFKAHLELSFVMGERLI